MQSTTPAHTGLNSEDATALAMVRLGYAVDDPTNEHRCLMFRAQFHTREGGDAALRAIDQYNDFDGERVIEALDSAQLDRYDSITVGREFSPVIYIRFGLMGNYDERAERAMEALKRASADEIDYDRATIRAWWD